MLRKTRPSQLFPALIALCSLVVLSAGCGPFGYIKKVARESSRAVAKAESSGAEENAPYEYWGSVTYLEQSKILMGYSEYERSFDYGERAKELAEEAERKAEMRRKGKDTERSEVLATPDEAPKADAEASGSAGDGKVKAGLSVGGGK